MEKVKREYVDVDLHEEANKWKQEQQEGLVIDFDDAVAEEKAKAIKVKFKGKVYELPEAAPAWLPLFINRHADEDGVLSDKRNLEMIENLLGKEFAAQIVDERNNFVSFESVNNRILQPVMERWGMAVEDKTDKKK